MVRRVLAGSVVSLVLVACAESPAGPAVAAAVGANVIQVPGNYATIQEAVDNALAGNEIQVRGAHDANVFITTPGIRLRAVAGATLYGALNVEADNVSIDGFRVTTAYHNQGIQANGVTGAEIKNNTVVSDGDGGVTDGDFRGIWMSNCTNCSVKNNTVTRHRFDGIGVALDLTGTEIKNNTVNGSPIGIFLFPSATGAALTNNAVAGYTVCGIVADGTVGNSFKNNRTGCTSGF